MELTREQVYLTSMVKCHTDRIIHHEELITCSKEWLKDEIRNINPSLVVVIGSIPWAYLTKDTVKFGHGVSLKGKKRTFAGIHHPAHYLRRGDVAKFVKVGKELITLYENS